MLAFLFGYSFAKRFTMLSHFWLGTAMRLAPLAAWVVIRARSPGRRCCWPGPWPWVAGFDMIYACQDVEFDRQAAS